MNRGNHTDRQPFETFFFLAILFGIWWWTTLVSYLNDLRNAEDQRQATKENVRFFKANYRVVRFYLLGGL